MVTGILVIGSVATAALAVRLVRGALAGARARSLLVLAPPAETAPTRERFTSRGRLERWLTKAGYRDPGAPTTFVAAAIVAAVCGTIVPVALVWLDVSAPMLEGFRAIPGGLGQAFAPIAVAAPVTIGLCMVAAPWMVVRRSRRRLVDAVEQDLPLTLDLLATLAEAGFGFDAALARVLHAADPERALARDLRLFQLELRSGRARVECFHRLRERLDAPSVNVLVSALVTSEQLGASVADVLRVQGDDMRGRRRERALALAQTVPVKLVFPLMICFLPSIFVITLGPAFYQLLQLADTVGRGAR